MPLSMKQRKGIDLFSSSSL